MKIVAIQTQASLRDSEQKREQSGIESNKHDKTRSSRNC